MSATPELVKRYGLQPAEMDPDPREGDWVRYADYESALLAAEARVNEVEAVVREVCLIENNEDGEDGAAYICINDNGDPFIEAETLGEAVKGIVQAWEWCQRKSEAAEARLREVEAEREKFREQISKLVDDINGFYPRNQAILEESLALRAERDALVPLARFGMASLDDNTENYGPSAELDHAASFGVFTRITHNDGGVSWDDTPATTQARAILAREAGK